MCEVGVKCVPRVCMYEHCVWAFYGSMCVHCCVYELCEFWWVDSHEQVLFLWFEFNGNRKVSLDFFLVTVLCSISFL